MITNFKIIDDFNGEYRFLSNFYLSTIKYKGKIYGSSEAAFQAQKTLNEDEKAGFQYLDPSQSKRAGRCVTLRPDWDKVKDQIMYEIVKEKFSSNSELKEKLIDTRDCFLIEGNTWNDTYWGMCKGIGLNRLGKILMTVRKELENE